LLTGSPGFEARDALVERAEGAVLIAVSLADELHHVLQPGVRLIQPGVRLIQAGIGLIQPGVHFCEPLLQPDVRLSQPAIGFVDPAVERLHLVPDAAQQSDRFAVFAHARLLRA
jgi:hypothetical protein